MASVTVSDDSKKKEEEEEAEDKKEEEEDDGEGNSTGLVRKKKVQKEGVGRPSAKRVKGDLHVPPHKKEKEKSAATAELLKKGIKANRFCKALSHAEVEAIAEEMEYYEFEAGETIVKEGDNGSYFFVTHEGQLEVSVNGKVVNSLGSGDAFGAIALLYDCPRTAMVVAKDKPAGVWGADGDVFRKIMKDHAQKHSEENRQFLDQMSCFDGLAAKDKELVGQLALLEESFDAGARVITQDEAAGAVYFVKEGALSFMSGGSIGSSGKLEGGERIGRLGKGDCFGWRAVLYGERQRSTVVVDERCHLVCVGVKQLEQVLGSDFADSLARSWVLSVLRNIPVMTMLTRSVRQQIANAFVTKLYAKGDKLPADTRIAIIADGTASGETASGAKVTVCRGQWCQDDALAKLAASEDDAKSKEEHPKLQSLVAGDKGCRIAMLSASALATAVSEMRPGKTYTAEQALEYLQIGILSQRVPIFRELSEEQVDKLVNALVMKKYKKDDKVFTQGEAGNAFFVIAAGEVVVDIDGKTVRTLGVHSSFGERALLFNERRSATVYVCSDAADMWSLDRDTFNQLISGSMRESLMASIKLQSKGLTMKILKHVRLIGAGSFGSVRMVEHKRTAVRYALKRIKKEGEEVPDEVQQECDLLAETTHPFVLKLVTTFESKNSIYILTDLITGGQLYEQVLERLGVINRKGAQFYVGSLCIILEYLHEVNIVYRDLKPENVMLDSQGYLKLVDFGLAKKLSENSARTFTLVGTLYYMAPEVIRGRGYGFECDIWSLGVLFYELVCGRLPFGDDREDDNEIFADVLEQPLEFPSKYTDSSGKKLIKAMLEREVDKRVGVSVGGWEDIKSNRFFKQGVSGDLFSQICGREITAPLVPSTESYSSETEMKDRGCSLSDKEELGRDDPLDVGCRVLQAFNKFDLNGDGKIDREELEQVLCGLNKTFFTPDVITQILDVADTDHDGKLKYDEFVNWVFSDEQGDVTSAFRSVADLDIRD